MKRYFLLLLSVYFASIAALAETITYRIVEYNADAGDFVLAAHGMRPVGSYAMFENDFGATRGNRYNQIPRNKQATLWLEGWEGCVINSVTLAMCIHPPGSTTISASCRDWTPSEIGDVALADIPPHSLRRHHCNAIARRHPFVRSSRRRNILRYKRTPPPAAPHARHLSQQRNTPSASSHQIVLQDKIRKQIAENHKTSLFFAKTAREVCSFHFFSLTLHPQME